MTNNYKRVNGLNKHLKALKINKTILNNNKQFYKKKLEKKNTQIFYYLTTMKSKPFGKVFGPSSHIGK